MNKIKLKKFDHKFDPTSTILIIGSRRSGKSFFAKYLVNKIKDFYSLILVFTNTKISKQWNDIIDSENIIDHYDPEILADLFKRYEILKENCPKINPYALVICDDIMDDTNIRNEPMLKKLFIIGRWFKIGCIITTQYLNLLDPTVRTNTDIVICPIQKSLQNKNILYESYGGLVNKKEFFKLLHQHTNDYSVFIVRNDTKSTRIEDNYFWDKAKIETKKYKNVQ